MKCERCGAQLDNNDEFCKMCGSRVKKANGSAQISNGYNPGPVSPAPFIQPNPPKQNNSVKYICIVIVILLLVGFGVYTVNKLSNQKTNENPTNTNTNNPVAQTASYQQRFANFTFSLPENYISEIKQGFLQVGDSDNTWTSYVLIADGTYSIAKTKANKIKIAFEQDGATISQYDVKTIDGREYMMYDCEKNSYKSIIAITKLDTNHVIQMQIFNSANTIDYDLVKKLTPLLESAKYNTISSSMSLPTENTNIDLNAIMAEEE